DVPGHSGGGTHEGDGDVVSRHPSHDHAQLSHRRDDVDYPGISHGTAPDADEARDPISESHRGPARLRRGRAGLSSRRRRGVPRRRARRRATAPRARLAAERPGTLSHVRGEARARVRQLGTGPGSRSGMKTRMAVATPLITIAGVGKTYRTTSGGVVKALDSVSLEVQPQEFVVVVGPSGCGKTTLLRILAGLASASAGRVRLRDEDVRGPRRDVGVVFQDAVLLPWRTVLGNVMLPALILRLDQVASRRRALELLELVGL